MKKIIIWLLPVFDVLATPFVSVAALLLKLVRSVGVHRLPLSKSQLIRIGVFPIRDHYYEPLFNTKTLSLPLNAERDLPGINFNVERQLDLLRQFQFSEELNGIGTEKVDDTTFYFGNGAFESGDAEFLYNIIRHKKPRRIFEIGSGNSTLIARRAIGMNMVENPEFKCKHVCIEPYEMPWLERTGVTVHRKCVEQMDPSFFDEMDSGDLLFIDSSHMIRPQGDVLFEFLTLLPRLKEGVIVHIHDIFSPRDYLAEWVHDEVKLWNEQYLLEAFLTCNTQWQVIGALNYLTHNHYDALSRVCPYLTRNREPGSFYIERCKR
jgi:hypothetical protein